MFTACRINGLAGGSERDSAARLEPAAVPALMAQLAPPSVRVHSPRLFPAPVPAQRRGQYFYRKRQEVCVDGAIFVERKTPGGILGSRRRGPVMTLESKLRSTDYRP